MIKLHQRLLGCFFILLLVLVGESKVWALDFYQARVPVANQSSGERKRAASEGLRQVLVRVSGAMDLAQSDDIQVSLNKASSYIDQYQYDTERTDWGDKQEFLSMSFSAAVIERLLVKAKLPFWPINRPKTLVWLVEDRADSGKQLVNDPKSPVLSSLQEAADVRGLPLRLPLLDLDDQLALSADSLWALDENAILDASERYQVDTVLVGRYTQTSTGQWWATWQFFHRGDSRLIDLRVDDVSQMGMQAISPLADYLAGLYAVVTNPELASQIVLHIDGIGSFRSYRQMMTYFQHLAAVSRFELLLLADRSVLLRVQLNADLAQFNNAISLDQKLRSEETQVSPDAPWMAVQRGTLGAPLHYQWFGG